MCNYALYFQEKWVIFVAIALQSRKYVQKMCKKNCFVSDFFQPCQDSIFE